MSRFPLLRLLSARAFTLIELLVVILVIGILIAVAAPSFLGQTQKAEDSASKQNLSVAYRAAKAFSVDSSTDGVQGHFNGFDAAALQEMEPGFVGHDGASCPEDAVGFDHNHIFIDTASGDDLTICADPDGKVWTLQVIDGVLQPFGEPYEGEGSEAAGPTEGVLASGLALNPQQLMYSLDDSHVIYYIDDGSTKDVFSVSASGGGTPNLIADGTTSTEAFFIGDSNGLSGGKVLFRRETLIGPTQYHLFSSPLTGGTSTALTAEHDYSLGAASPDGSKIAYVGGPIICTTDSIERTQLFVMNADGTGKTQLTDECVSNTAGEPRWSPDGQYILYTDGSNRRVIAASGGAAQTLPANASDIAWSPDSSKLAYHIGGEIFVLNGDGSGTPLSVAPASYDASSPVWASNTSVFFIGTTDANLWESSDLFSVSSSGGTVTNLTNNATDTYLGAVNVSPDGQRVAFTRQVGPSYTDHLYTASTVDLSDELDIGVATGGFPRLGWSHDSSLLVYSVLNGSEFDIVASSAKP